MATKLGDAPRCAIEFPELPLNTIVLQSFRRHDVPEWLALCMDSVQKWSKMRGWMYRFLDDRFFELAPAIARERCAGNIYALTDICRLRWMQQELDAGWKRVVWVDADVVVFAPDLLDVATRSGHAFAHEVFLSLRENGGFDVLDGCNNALMVFDSRGREMLDRYLASCLARLAGLPAGSVPRTALGPSLLKEWRDKGELELIDNVGLFTYAIMKQVAEGTGRLPAECARRARGRLAAANLCHFLRNATPPEQRPAFDELYLKAVTTLLVTQGGILVGNGQSGT